MQTIDQWLMDAVAALGPGNAEDIVRKLEAEIRDQPAAAVPRINLGIALMSAGHDARALALLEHAMALTDRAPVGWLALGAARRRAGDLRGAATAIWNAARLIPEDGDLKELMDQASEALRTRARELSLAEQHDAAEDLFDHALLLNPMDWSALHDQGIVAYRRGNLRRAVELLQRSLAGRTSALALCNLGAALADLGRIAEALATYRRCIDLFPDHAPAYYNAGCSLASLGRLSEAKAMYDRAITATPTYAEAYNNLGNLQADLGRPAEAVASFRTAVELKPDYAQAHSNLLFNLYYLPEVTGEELAAESRRWGALHGQIPQTPAIHRNRRDPDARLKVGYLSPDFRDHAASYFLEPLLAFHDQKKFEVTCYASKSSGDHVTERMRGYGHAWRDVAQLNDQALAELIRNDAIDILVDCAGHSHGNRLAMFAREPAPLQLGNHLGMAGTLGVPAIRHFVTDRYISPEGSDGHYTENVVRLPHAFLPFRVRPEWPEVSARNSGPPLFACFAEPLRISPGLVALWQRILEGVPESRLLLKHGRYENPQVLARYRHLLAPLGARVDFEGIEGGWEKHWQVYGRVAVMLDGFPVTGATSTIIPLWMGVPVISLAGTHSGQRFGVSMLTNAGVPELIAPTPDAYVALATSLALNNARLKNYRATLRSTLSASPLLNCAGIVGELEESYRRLWRGWCRNTP